MIIITVDLNNGTTLPDHKIVEWAESKINEALDNNKQIHIRIGSDLIITAFRYLVKTKKLEAGFIKLVYSDNTTDFIDKDGNISYIPTNHDVLSEMLITLL